MEPEEFLDIIKIAGRLKTNFRHCETVPGRKESIADHSYRIALMAMIMTGEEEYQDLDMNKVIRMCLIHDLGEAFTGDIPTFEKSSQDEVTEQQILDDWVAGFSEPQRQEWTSLFAEMEAQQTREAKLYKALDKLEAVISHNESDIASWLPLENELQLTYGREQVVFSPHLEELKSRIDSWTKDKIEQNGK